MRPPPSSAAAAEGGGNDLYCCIVRDLTTSQVGASRATWTPHTSSVTAALTGADAAGAAGDMCSVPLLQQQ
jgi:hypothetical protein